VDSRSAFVSSPCRSTLVGRRLPAQECEITDRFVFTFPLSWFLGFGSHQWADTESLGRRLTLGDFSLPIDGRLAILGGRADPGCSKNASRMADQRQPDARP
jgi:hypothetical protein